jgi:hypothetical protein
LKDNVAMARAVDSMPRQQAVTLIRCLSGAVNCGVDRRGRPFGRPSAGAAYGGNLSLTW